MNIRFLCVFMVFFAMYITTPPCEAGGRKKNELYDIEAICRDAAYQFDYNKQLEYSKILLSAARENGDRNFEAAALFYMGASQLFTGKGDEAGKNLNDCLMMSLKLDNDSLSALAYNSLAIYEGMVNNNLNITQRHLLKARDYAVKGGFQHLLSSIYNNLSEVARRQGDADGLEYAMQMYQSAIMAKDVRAQYLSSDNLAYFYYLSGDMRNAEKYYNEAIRLRNANSFQSTGDLYGTMAMVKLSQGQLDRAEEYSLLNLNDCGENSQNEIPNALYILALVNNRRNQFSKSNEILQEAWDSAMNLHIMDIQEKIERLRAENLHKLHFPELAYASLARADSISSRLHDEEKRHLSYERKMLFEIMEKDYAAEKMEMRARQHRVLIWILSLSVLLLFSFTAYMVYSVKRRKELHMRIVAKYKEAIRLHETNLNLLEKVDQHDSGSRPQQPVQATDLNSIEKDMVKETGTTSQQPPEESMVTEDNTSEHEKETLEEKESGKIESDSLDGIINENNKEIYLKICRMMEQERLYADPMFTREALVDRLGTNRTYLTNIIKENFGGNYAQFINSYRLKEATEILSDPKLVDYPIKRLSAEIGFISTSTFYKVFQKEFGMSPNSFRNSAIKLNEKGGL